MVPLCSVVWPITVPSSVDLPTPLRPKSASVAFGGKLSDTPSSTTVSPNPARTMSRTRPASLMAPPIKTILNRQDAKTPRNTEALSLLRLAPAWPGHPRISLRDVKKKNSWMARLKRAKTAWVSWRLGVLAVRVSFSSMARPLAEIDLAHARVGGDFGRRAFGQDRALYQHGDAPRQAEHQIHVVLDDQQREVRRQVFDDVNDDAAFRRRHPGRRLVEQQHVRLEPERDRDLDETLTPIRQFADQPVGVVGEAKPLQERVGRQQDLAMRACGTEQAAAGAEPLADREADIFEDAQAAEQRVDLEGACEAAPHPLFLRQRGDIGATEQNLARARLERAGDEIDERGLARAVGPDQRMARAGLEPEIHAARHLERAEAAIETARFESRLGIRPLGLRASHF